MSSGIKYAGVVLKLNGSTLEQCRFQVGRQGPCRHVQNANVAAELMWLRGGCQHNTAERIVTAAAPVPQRSSLSP